MKIFKCDCNTEGIVVTKIDDALEDCEGSPFIELSFWKYGQCGRYDWRFRLKTIWNIIKHGTPYLDMVILRTDVAKEFGEYLINITSKSKKAILKPEPLPYEDIGEGEIPKKR